MPRLSVVIPTFNGQDNIEVIYSAVSTGLAEPDREVIFVASRRSARAR